MPSRGRFIDVAVLIGTVYTPIGKIRSKSLAINCETVDVTDIDSDDWRYLDPNGLGTRSVSVSGTGFLYDPQDEAVQVIEDAILDNAGLVDLTITFENGDYFQGNFKIASFDRSGAINDAVTFSFSAESSGEITLTRTVGFTCPVPGADCTLATWTARGATNYATNDVKWDGSQFVAASNHLSDGGGAIRASSDGLSWTDYGIKDDADFTAIGFDGAGNYVAGARDGDIYDITDITTLATWTRRVPTGANVGDRVVSVDYFAHLGLWVAVMDNTTVVTSTDRVTWTQVYNYEVGAYTYSKVVYDGTQLVFVATPNAGSSFVIITSTDGASWSAGSTIGSDDGVDIDYDCQLGVYKVCTYNGDVYSTTDLTTGWTSMTVATTGGWFNTIYYSDYIGAWLVGGGNDIHDSLDDGATWNDKTVTAFSVDIYCFADNQSNLYVAGSDPQTNSNQTTVWSNQCTI